MPARAVQSMTGYGRAITRTSLGSVTVELRSTNHRYLEIDQRLPNGLGGLQDRVAELVRRNIQRGRVEASVFVQSEQPGRRVNFDDALLRRYHEALVELKANFGLKGQVTLDHLLALPQAITVTEERLAPDRLWEPIRAAVVAAVQDLVRARRREGTKLATDLRRQFQAIAQHLRAITRRLPAAMVQQREALRGRLQALVGKETASGVAQLEQAASLIKDVDIHEEMVRLESHLVHMRQALASGRPVGKQLDFIAQELMREANTMGAKVNDAIAAQRVVAIQGCIEKIREQVQNLE